MPISIAEYLGQRTDITAPAIDPVVLPSDSPCPFMDAPCSKTSRAKPYHPVCSVRQSDGSLWIVCPERLCSTKTNIALNDYQRDTLYSIAELVYGQNIPKKEILVKREVAVPTTSNPDDEYKTKPYRADYVMSRSGLHEGPKNLLIEMQGGGETSATGTITRYVKSWADNPNRTNELLSAAIPSDGNSYPGPIVTNAWRRQQEQFIVKGNVTIQTGGRMVFCVGELIYDYLWAKLKHNFFPKLQDAYWTLALITFSENTSYPKVAGPIPIEINQEKILFTNYATFVQALINQGGAHPSIFEGDFLNLED